MQSLVGCREELHLSELGSQINTPRPRVSLRRYCRDPCLDATTILQGSDLVAPHQDSNLARPGVRPRTCLLCSGTGMKAGSAST